MGAEEAQLANECERGERGPETAKSEQVGDEALGGEVVRPGGRGVVAHGRGRPPSAAVAALDRGAVSAEGVTPSRRLHPLRMPPRDVFNYLSSRG